MTNIARGLLLRKATLSAFCRIENVEMFILVMYFTETITNYNYMFLALIYVLPRMQRILLYDEAVSMSSCPSPENEKKSLK